jgi:DNA-binding response OmpR family regulator
MGTTTQEIEREAIRAPEALGEVFAPLCNARLSTVLLIEDNEDLNESLSARLQCSNFNVVSALDGMRGLELVLSEEPDIVVLDLGLPRLHGYKLLHRIRMEPALTDTPIVVLTGSPDPDLYAKVAAWNVKRVLYKPISQRRVVRTIRDVLEHD